MGNTSSQLETTTNSDHHINPPNTSSDINKRPEVCPFPRPIKIDQSEVSTIGTWETVGSFPKLHIKRVPKPLSNVNIYFLIL